MYYTNPFQPFFAEFANNVTRMDIVFDNYNPDSLKNEEREQRGMGPRIRVKDSTRTPKKWTLFLKNTENKTELFRLLCKHLQTINDSDGKRQIVCAYDDSASVNSDIDITSLIPCKQEEADTRMFLHVQHASNHGHTNILIKTVDSDVVVIAVALFFELEVSYLWIEYGTGKNKRYLPVHEIANSLGKSRSKALLFWHAFTGCDTVSAFGGRGKKTAWQVWEVFPEITDTFIKLSNTPVDISAEDFAALQRFTVLLYDRSSCLLNVNDCRRMLMARKNCSYEGIPPTEGALFQHCLRAALVAGITGLKLCKKCL